MQVSEVTVFYDGTYEIKDMGESDYHAPQCIMYGVRHGKQCQTYYCDKNQEKYYLKQLVTRVIMEKDKLMHKMTREKYALIGILEFLRKEDKNE